MNNKTVLEMFNKLIGSWETWTKHFNGKNSIIISKEWLLESQAFRVHRSIPTLANTHKQFCLCGVVSLLIYAKSQKPVLGMIMIMKIFKTTQSFV